MRFLEQSRAVLILCGFIDGIEFDKLAQRDKQTRKAGVPHL